MVFTIFSNYNFCGLSTLTSGSMAFLYSFAVSHDLSWANHISKLASKASCRLSIFHRTKSFLSTPELRSTYKAFIRSLKEDCSPLEAVFPASHLVQLDAMETKAFKTIVVFCNEAELMGPSRRHCKQVGDPSVCSSLFSGLSSSALSMLYPPQVSAGHTRSIIKLLLVKLPKSRIIHLVLFFPIH